MQQLQTRATNIPCELRPRVCDLLENDDSRLITEARSPQIAKFNKQYLQHSKNHVLMINFKITSRAL